MQRETEKTILEVAKEQEHSLEERMGVETSMSEQEIRDYLQEVLSEVENVKRRRWEKIIVAKSHCKGHKKYCRTCELYLYLVLFGVCNTNLINMVS